MIKKSYKIKFYEIIIIYLSKFKTKIYIYIKIRIKRFLIY